MIEIDFKYIASEIVRAMTNAKLTKDQQEKLQYVSEIILKNKLQIKEKK